MVTFLPLTAGDPTQLGPYTLRGILGEGGMGVVYLATAPDQRVVAVKAIHRPFVSNPEFLRRFRREVEAARRVPRYCTAAVLDADLDAAQPYLVTEYIDGPTLEAAVSEHGPLTGSALDALAVGVAAALTAIHEVGVVHRDLKPGNVLLSAAGPRVIDFGIASAAGTTSHTLTGQFMGTPAYMAPEQISGERATGAADVFAWGSVVAFAASGVGPFGATNSIPAIMHRILHEPPRLDALEPGLRAMVGDTLAKDPSRRPTSAALLHQLRLYVDQGPARETAAAVIDLATRTPSGGLPTALPNEGPTVPPQQFAAQQFAAQRVGGAATDSRPSRRLPVLLAVAAVLLVLLGVTAVIDPLGWREEPGSAAADEPTDETSTTKGETPESGETVDLDEPSTLTDYVGDTKEIAEAELRADGVLVSIEARASTRAQQGRVMDMSKEPGAVLHPGDAITLYVGDGSLVENQDWAVFKGVSDDPINVAPIIVRSPDGRERKVGMGDSPDIRADGGLVVYIGHDENFAGQVMTVGPDGKNRRQVTDVTVGSAADAAISPDGGLIAYSNNTGGIFVINADGTGKQQISDVDAFELDWSPDGTQIVFRRYDVSPQGLWVMNSDGTGLRDLNVTVGRGATASFPRWSPDGETIVFSDFQGNILTVPAAGGRTRTVASGGSPSWTPDGRICFLSGTQVTLVDADGQGQESIDGLFASDAVQWGRE